MRSCSLGRRRYSRVNGVFDVSRLKRRIYAGEGIVGEYIHRGRTIESPYPEVFTLDLNSWDDENKQSDNNPITKSVKENSSGTEGHLRRFDTKGLQGAVLRSPRDLEICDGETSQSTCQVDQRGNFTFELREAVVAVCVCIKLQSYRMLTNLRRYSHTATVLIMTATSAIPQPMTTAPTDNLFWNAAPKTRKPQRYNGIAM